MNKIFSALLADARSTALAALLAVAVAASLVITAWPLAAVAQASAPMPAPAPGPAASVGPLLKPSPRLLTPAETRENATGDLRPERPVTPQISIPLGRKPPPATEPRAAGKSAPPTTVDDAAARCEAQVGEQVRVACRDKIARENRARAPG